ncbi:hypothetical protein BKA81DRAFT_138245 [Phyllosticta paracitricarpa]
MQKREVRLTLRPQFHHALAPKSSEQSLCLAKLKTLSLTQSIRPSINPPTNPSIQKNKKKPPSRSNHCSLPPPSHHTAQLLSSPFPESLSGKSYVPQTQTGCRKAQKSHLPRTGLNCQPPDCEDPEGLVTVRRASQLRHGGLLSRIAIVENSLIKTVYQLARVMMLNERESFR